MTNYAITVSPDEAGREYNVKLCGPGIDSAGRGYVFATTARCATFVEAVNFAYEQGVRDGMARTELLVTGSTPDSVSLRVESRWSQWKRRWMPAC